MHTTFSFSILAHTTPLESAALNPIVDIMYLLGKKIHIKMDLHSSNLVVQESTVYGHSGYIGLSVVLLNFAVNLKPL